MKSSLKTVLVIGTLECVLMFLFAYRSSCLVQFAAMTVGLVFLLTVLATGLQVLESWREHRTKSLYPFLLALTFLLLVLASGMAGFRWRTFVFRHRLPRYQEILTRIEKSEIVVEARDQEAFVPLPSEYASLTSHTRARTDANGVVSARFQIGSAFPVKHQLLLYRRDGNFAGWRVCVPIDRHWALASD